MRILLNILLILLPTLPIHAQVSRIDSLRTLLESSISDTQKAEVCSRISMLNLPSDYTQALSYAYLSLTFAQRTNDPVLIGDAFNRIANVYSFLDVPEIATTYYRQGLTQLKDDTSFRKKSRLHGFIGQAYLDMNQFDSARIHFNLSRTYGIRENDKPWLALLDVFTGNLYAHTSPKDSAIYYYSIARDFYQSHHNNNLIQQCNINLANVYLTMGNTSKAFVCLSQAERTGKDTPSSTFYCRVEQALAGYFITYKDAGQALPYLHNADYSLKLHPNPPLRKEQQLLYAKYYKSIGNAEKAFFARKEYIHLSDSIYKSKLMIIHKIMELRYQSESRTGEINLLEKDYQYQLIKNTKNDNLRKIGVATIIVLLITLVLIIISIFFKKRSARKLNNQKKELQRLYDQLSSKEEVSLHEKQIRDKLFSVITHNLINPFNILLGFTSLLSEEIQDYNRDEIKKYASLIHDSSKNLQFLLENLLQWSRLQTNRIAFQPGYFEIKDVISRLKTAFQLLSDKKEITFIVNLPDESIVFGDESIIEVVLKNLIHNAIKYSYNGSTIEISGKTDQTDFTLSVRDEGTGILPEDEHMLFNMEHHFSKKGTAGEEGTGLGLILTKELLKMHDRSLSFQTTPGKGSTFSFSLPLTRQNHPDHDDEKPNL